MRIVKLKIDIGLPDWKLDEPLLQQAASYINQISGIIPTKGDFVLEGITLPDLPRQSNVSVQYRIDVDDVSNGEPAVEKVTAMIALIACVQIPADFEFTYTICDDVG